MNNLKKVLALVLAFTMVLGMGVFAAPFADVAEDATYAEAVTMLSSLGILNGYEDGSFKPEGEITRAEFAKVIMSAMGNAEGAAASATAQKFSDVPATHWAAGFVNAAAGLGIINGMGDGTFAPEAPVTYEQAVKMIVCALGYAPMAEYLGGFPTGYLTVASNSLKITKGATGQGNEPAKRWVVARLVFNSLEVSMMEQTNWNPNDPTYEIPEDAKTLLKDYLEIDKLEGVVIGTKYTTDELDKENNDVVISVTKINGEKQTAAEEPIDAGTTNADAYLGQSVIVYVTDLEESDVPTILAIAPQTGENISKTLDVTAFKGEDTVTLSEKTNKATVEYYNEDTDKDVKIYVDEEATVVVNGDISDDDFAGNTDMFDAYHEDATIDGYVTFIDNDADKVYDYVFVTEYNGSYVVDSVKAKTHKLTMKDGKGTLVLDPEDEDKVFVIYKDGAEIELADIAENDVVTILANKTGSSISTINKASVVNVYVSSNSVEGKITKVNKDGTYTIAGEKYKAIAGAGLSLGDEGVFYLNANGKIVGADENTVSTVGGTYAYVLNAKVAESDDWNEVVKVSYIDAEGNSATKVVDERVYIYTYDADEEAAVKDNGDKEDGVDELLDRLDATVVFNVTGDTIAVASAVEKRIIKIEINSDDEISKIYIPSATESEDYFSYIAEEDDMLYDAEDVEFVGTKKFAIEEDTVVFTLDDATADSAKEVKVTKGASVFRDTQAYGIVGMKAADEDVFEAIVCFSGSDSVVAEESKIFVATEDGSDVIVDDEEVIGLYGLYNGEEKEFFTDAEGVDYYTLNEDGEIASDEAFPVEEGDVLLLTFNDDGAVTGIACIYTLKDAEDGNTFELTATVAGKEVTTVAGFAGDTNSKGTKVDLYEGIDAATEFESLVIGGGKLMEDASFYLVDTTPTRGTTYEVASASEITAVGEFETQEDAEEETVSIVVARVVDGETVDVVIYTVDADADAYWAVEE